VLRPWAWFEPGPAAINVVADIAPNAAIDTISQTRQERPSGAAPVELPMPVTE
jgi:hypothetical protein